MKSTLDKPMQDRKQTPSGEFDEKLWRDRFPSEPYTVDSDSFDDYSPAYRFGSGLRGQVDDFDLHESELRERWESVKGESRLAWDRAKDAVRSAWESDFTGIDNKDPARMS